jgi:xylulokinase
MVALGMRPTEVRLVGGGSKNKLWRQIVADVFQLPVRLPLEPESAALGAALQAGAVHSGVGVAAYVHQHMPPLSDEVVQPQAGCRQAYAVAFARYQEQGVALFGAPPAAR